MLSKRDRHFLDKLERNEISLDDPSVTAEMKTIMFETSAVRDMVLRKFNKYGIISNEAYELMATRDYTSRMNAKNYFRQEFAEGEKIGIPQAMGSKVMKEHRTSPTPRCSVSSGTPGSWPAGQSRRTGRSSTSRTRLRLR
jgi:hypothetical protein